MENKNLSLCLANFEALKDNIPPSIRQDFVDEYNRLVNSLSRVTGENLASFQIQSIEMKHKVVGSRRAAYGGGRGSTTYSADKYCDDILFRRRIQALDNYLKGQGYTQLRDVTPPPHSSLHIGTMIGSAVQQGVQHSHITVGFDAHSDDFRDFLVQLKRASSHLQLPGHLINQLNIDIATIEVQVHSALPKKSIIAECGASIRSIFEQAAGSVIASGLLPLIYNYFPK
jgi:hypothetical protein